MIIMMLGDVVGEPGLMILEKRLPALIGEYGADFVIVNGENAAAGFGLSAETLDRILAAGADAVTSGNHIWEKRDFWDVLSASALPGGKPVLRPANYPAPLVDGAAAVPGRGAITLTKGGAALTVLNLQGRERMAPIDCPFACFDSFAAKQSGVPIVVDFHAESTEEKEALAYYVDGRAALVAGTHTHVQTADERVLPGGTAYISDLGMTGAVNGIIGMDKNICVSRARSQVARKMECAAVLGTEDCAVEGIVVELAAGGGALRVTRIRR